MNRSTSPLVVLLALAIDVIFGDPPNKWHPVAWMGTLIAKLKEQATLQQNESDYTTGVGISATGLGLSALAGVVLEFVSRNLPNSLRLLLQAIVLKSTFSVRGLDDAAAEVSTALKQYDLPKAQQQLSWHLVSRDTSGLNEPQVAAATIESVAENTSDGVVAPLLFYALFGLPGALAYRFANTADAMLGYRDAEREWLGKFPAKLDDVLNWLPARLSAMIMVLVGRLLGRNPNESIEIIYTNQSETASPNAGYPMSAAAAALDVSLEKVGHYNLHPNGRIPNRDDIDQARILMWLTVAIATLLSGIFATRRNR